MSVFWSNGFWSFVVLTVVLGGMAAWMSGRAVARNWRPMWQLWLYCVLLALAVRFLHFALFQSDLLSTPMLLIDLIVMLFFGFVGHRFTRAGQMSTQYGWQYERSGLFSWREKTR